MVDVSALGVKLALRQQLAVLHRNGKRPKLTNADRAFWVALFGLWPDWQNALILLKSETVIGWHRKDFKLYWSRRAETEAVVHPSTRRFGRSSLAPKPRDHSARPLEGRRPSNVLRNDRTSNDARLRRTPTLSRT